VNMIINPRFLDIFVQVINWNFFQVHVKSYSLSYFGSWVVGNVLNVLKVAFPMMLAEFSGYFPKDVNWSKVGQYRIRSPKLVNTVVNLSYAFL
jgi:hypothetical protein